MAARVSQCENGGSWLPQGSAYPNGIGMTAANWAQFDPHLTADDLDPANQAAALAAFLAHYGMAWPDQNGCTGSY